MGWKNKAVKALFFLSEFLKCNRVKGKKSVLKRKAFFYFDTTLTLRNKNVIINFINSKTYSYVIFFQTEIARGQELDSVSRVTIA